MRLVMVACVMALVGCATVAPKQAVQVSQPTQRRDAHVNLSGAELRPAGMFR